jgi:hypothetical protein
MSLVEYEQFNGGASTDDILTMADATSLSAHASFLNIKANAFGNISVTATLDPDGADDGDVLRIECLLGDYPGSRTLAEVRVIFTKLTLTLSDDGTAGNAPSSRYHVGEPGTRWPAPRTCPIWDNGYRWGAAAPAEREQWCN